MSGAVRFSLLIAVGLTLLPHHAEANFSEATCALIVASRKDTVEVDQFIRENPLIPIHGVYLSKNGWFAIASQLLDEASSKEQIRKLASLGLIPADSYCSDGASYIQAVAGYGVSQSQSVTSQRATPVSPDFNGEFDARTMTAAEKRFLQAALALTGHYNGLIDGAWGRGSQSALEAFTREEFQEEPTNGHAAVVIFIAAKEFLGADWQPREFPEVGVSMLLPNARMSRLEKNGANLALDDKENEIAIRMTSSESALAGALHGVILDEHSDTSEPYLVRRDDFWVTSVSGRAHRTYLWSRRNPDTRLWSNVLLSSPKEAFGSALIISSLSTAPLPPLEFPEGGYIDENVTRLLDVLDNASKGDVQAGLPPQHQDQPAPDSDSAGTSTGTGFFVNESSVVLTNAHVVRACESVRVSGLSARVIAQDENFDLAAISIDGGPQRNTWLSFAETPARLNSDVTIAGFPLHGLLGGLNVTRGSISGLKGLGGDSTTFQLSAPVQPGNSGGPVVNARGQVVGVVVSKLDAIAVADAIGDVPQNVNFAIRGEVAKLFLSVNGIRLHVESGAEGLDGADLADRLTESTALIECDRR